MNISLIFTFIRLTLSPVLAIAFVIFLPVATETVRMLLALLFAILATTDFLDGYLARRLKKETVLGAVLDPIADKILVASVCIALVQLQLLFWLWAIIIIGRELVITGLREYALTQGFSLPVSVWGKYKSALQYAYIFWLIAGFNLPIITMLLTISMLVATVGSAYGYIKQYGQ